MKSIGFVGPFGDSNFGDYAMLVNNIYEIGCKDICIFTYNNAFLEEMADFYLTDFNAEIYEVKMRNIPEVKTGKSFTAEFDTYPYIPPEVIAEVCDYDALWQKISQIDTLVVSGGGFLNHLWNAKHRQYKLFAVMAVVLIANQQNKKIVFMGNTYGPFDDSTEFYRFFFSRIKNAVYASRDNIASILNMNSIGVKQNIEILPDDLYFINDKLKEKNKNYFKKYNDYIILEMYESIAYFEDNKEMIKEFADAIKERYNLDTLFLPLDKQYGGQYQGELLEKECKLRLYNLEQGFLPIEEAIDIISNARFVICQRYHLFVLSIANNIPVIQLLKTVCGDKRYYYNKSIGMLEGIFSSQAFDESYFLELDAKNAFDKVVDKLDNIICTQKQLFNNLKRQDEDEMLDKRIRYIRKNIL